MSTITSSPRPPETIVWAQPERATAFAQWLTSQAHTHALLADSVRLASADASFRRYFRVNRRAGGSCIIMDAPPAQENCEPFVRIAGVLHDAGLLVPRILSWDGAQGFMLLDDLGTDTMMAALQADNANNNSNTNAHNSANSINTHLPLFKRATDTLLQLQQHAQPTHLPAYDEALLMRELSLFPEWYVQQHKGWVLDSAQQNMLQHTFQTIVQHNLAAPKVFVHRDFMPRNLMLPYSADEPRLGVLDFQDAVHGPITYDIASLMRDAFVSWDEELVLDVTIRYWERAKKCGLMDFEDWSHDFGAFWRAVEWMGLQRHLKVAGIFARLTLRDGKPKYLADAPRFIGYIRATASRYHELTPLLRFIDKMEGTEPAINLSFPRLNAQR